MVIPSLVQRYSFYMTVVMPCLLDAPFWLKLFICCEFISLLTVNTYCYLLRKRTSLVCFYYCGTHCNHRLLTIRGWYKDTRYLSEGIGAIPLPTWSLPGSLVTTGITPFGISEAVHNQWHQCNWVQVWDHRFHQFLRKSNSVFRREVYCCIQGS